MFDRRKPLTSYFIDRYLQFAVIMGRHSTTGSCKPTNMPGDGVLVQYTINRGMTWSLLKLIPYQSEKRVKYGEHVFRVIESLH